MRVGHGYDAHAFEAGRPLILGGVKIPFERGMRAHSDGDVVIHALCDALLGAAALGDIGRHFPDTDPQYKSADSRGFLRRVAELLDEENYSISNVDMMILAQVPKLAPHLDNMRTNLASDLNLDIHQINIKATTTEHMGFVGREEGIATHAVVLITS